MSVCIHRVGFRKFRGFRVQVATQGELRSQGLKGLGLRALRQPCASDGLV